MASPSDKGAGVFNGDMGIIREINEYAENLTVEFDEGKMVEYSFKQLEELELPMPLPSINPREANIRQ